MKIIGAWYLITDVGFTHVGNVKQLTQLCSKLRANNTVCTMFLVNFVYLLTQNIKDEESIFITNYPAGWWASG